MTEESNNTESTPPEKLSVDKPSDFQFHAAYLAYSEVFDRTSSAEVKKALNENITALQENQINYTDFYSNINRYRAMTGSQNLYSRAFIKTQRKKDWRREAQKHVRNRRHRK